MGRRAPPVQFLLLPMFVDPANIKKTRPGGHTVEKVVIVGLQKTYVWWIGPFVCTDMTGFGDTDQPGSTHSQVICRASAANGPWTASCIRGGLSIPR